MADYKDQVSEAAAKKFLEEASPSLNDELCKKLLRSSVCGAMNQFASELLPIIEAKEKGLNVTNYLLESQYRVINAIPECELHGNRCIPNAVEWINKQLANQKDAIGFAEWIAGCMYERIIDKVGEEYKAVGWSCGDDEILTTQELYELYLKQKV